LLPTQKKTLGQSCAEATDQPESISKSSAAAKRPACPK